MMPLDNKNLYDIRYGGMKMASQGGIPPGSNHRHHGAPFLFIKECFLENSSFFAGENIFGGQIRILVGQKTDRALRAAGH